MSSLWRGRRTWEREDALGWCCSFGAEPDLFFEGNNLLPKGQRRKLIWCRPAYTTALRLFYKFVIARRRVLLARSCNLGLSQEENEGIESAISLTDGLLKGLGKSLGLRNQEIQTLCCFILFGNSEQTESGLNKFAQFSTLLSTCFHFRRSNRRALPQQLAQMSNLAMNVEVEGEFLFWRKTL